MTTEFTFLGALRQYHQGIALGDHCMQNIYDSVTWFIWS